MIRVAAILTGIALVCTSAHALIMSSGGYQQTAAVTTMALAAGIIVGSICFGTNSRPGIGWAIVLAMLAGEGYALFGTADRVVTAREIQQAPLREAAERHRIAQEALRTAESAVPAAAPRDRLEAAERNHSAALEAARGKAAEMGCKANCAALLQSAADDASREVAAARDEIAAHNAGEAQRIAQRIADAQAALAQSPEPASANPLADRLGMAPWALDLTIAALLSVGLNGLAAVLIAFGAHSPRAREARPTEPKGRPSNVVTLPPPNTVTRFMIDRIERSPRSRVDVTVLFAAYENWCRERGAKALPAASFADALVPVLEGAGIRRRALGDDVFLVDVKLAG